MLRYLKPKSADEDPQTSLQTESAQSVAELQHAEAVGLNQIVSLTELPSESVDVQFPTTKQYYVMDGSKSKSGKTTKKRSSGSKREHDHDEYYEEEFATKKLKKVDSENPDIILQKLLEPRARHDGNRCSSLPKQTSITSFASTTKSSSSSRDMSKLPTEESPSSSSTSCTTPSRTPPPAIPPGSCFADLPPDLQYKAMLMWQKIRAENLDCDYVKLFGKREADKLFQELNATLTYYTGELSQIKIYGKTVEIPRKQVAHGDEGVVYKYSGTKIPAKPWTPALKRIKQKIEEITQHSFNFVLINRYEDGKHYMGEHRDDEKELRHGAPIASVSLGSVRDFVFRHMDSRGTNAKRNIPPIKLQLEHGSLLVMKYPTNAYWYHALPVRRKCLLPRINLTFRDIVN